MLAVALCWALELVQRGKETHPGKRQREVLIVQFLL